MKVSKFFDGCPIGNCGERVNRIFHQLAKQRGFDVFVIAQFEPGSHQFVIFYDNDTKNPLILDGWNGANIHLMRESKKHLKDYVTTHLADGRAELQSFDPQTQNILGQVWNIFRVSDFKEAAKIQYPRLFTLLEEFHKTSHEQEREKMLKALEMIRLIEDKMPLYEYIDPALYELYKQMLYLTKKVRKQGLKLPPQKDEERCLVNEALINLDLKALRQSLKDNEKMDALTIIQALKASLRANDIRFLKEVVDAKVPICGTRVTEHFHHIPGSAIMQLASELTAANGSLELTSLCSQAVKNQHQ